MRKTVVALTGLALLVACSPESPPPPAPPIRLVTLAEPMKPYPEATEVRLVIYDYVDRKRVYVGGERGRKLTAPERDAFEANIRRVTVVQRPPPDGTFSTSAACFIPHHFFQYFDRAGRQIGQIAVCFCCEGAQADPALPVETGKDQYFSYDIRGMARFVAELGLPTDLGCD